MRPLRYSINVTLDGCCDHMALTGNEEIHRHATSMLARADALLFGRITYEMMESAWKWTGTRPAWMADWMEPFAKTIDRAKKYVVSSRLTHTDWNSEIVRGDLRSTVEKLKSEAGEGIYVGGLTLPRALTELRLIDEYEFLVHPRIVGHGPYLFSELTKHVDLKLVGREELGSGAMALRYVPL